MPDNPNRKIYDEPLKLAHLVEARANGCLMIWSVSLRTYGSLWWPA